MRRTTLSVSMALATLVCACTETSGREALAPLVFVHEADLGRPAALHMRQVVLDDERVRALLAAFEVRREQPMRAPRLLTRIFDESGSILLEWSGHVGAPTLASHLSTVLAHRQVLSAARAHPGRVAAGPQFEAVLDLWRQLDQGARALELLELASLSQRPGRDRQRLAALRMEVLLDAGEIAAARRVSESTDGEALPTLELARARLLYAERETARAAAILTTYRREVDADASGAAGVLLAEVLWDSGQVERAEAVLERVVARAPRFPVSLRAADLLRTFRRARGDHTHDAESRTEPALESLP